MVRRMFLFALAGVVAGLACSRGGGPALKELTVEEVAAKIAANDGKTVLYDCNSKERYAKGHLPGARWVPFDAVTAADLPTQKDTLLVFYCASSL
jgi:rhodanese-related sulfurtransferase